MMQVIGRYRPRDEPLGWMQDRVRAMLKAHRPDLLDLSYSDELRVPEDCASLVRRRGDNSWYGADVNYWHQDGEKDQNDFWLVLWANHHPTCVRPIGSDTEFVTRDGEFVLFRNDLHEHHTPHITVAQASDRWFYRGNIGVDEAHYRRCSQSAFGVLDLGLVKES
jgi:hypothetical protein